MDLISGFKSELFRPLVTLFIPGAVATSPYILIAARYFPEVPAFWNQHPSAFVAALAVVIVSVGLILEDIGSRIETVWDRVLQHRDDSHDPNWDAYLKLKVKDEFIGERYLRSVVIRMKFELAMLPALILFGCGLVSIQIIDHLWRPLPFVLLLVILSGLLFYVGWESFQSATALSHTRRCIIAGVEEDFVKKLACAMANVDLASDDNKTPEDGEKG